MVTRFAQNLNVRNTVLCTCSVCVKYIYFSDNPIPLKEILGSNCIKVQLSVSENSLFLNDAIWINILFEIESALIYQIPTSSNSFRKGAI